MVSPAIPGMKQEWALPWSGPQCWGSCLSPWALFFFFSPTVGIRMSGETSLQERPHCTAMREEASNLCVAAHLTFPFKKSVLISVSYWILSDSPPCSKNLSVVPVYEELLTVLVRGSKVRNSLCHHLGDVTSLSCLSLCHSILLPCFTFLLAHITHWRIGLCCTLTICIFLFPPSITECRTHKSRKFILFALVSQDPTIMHGTQ